MLLWLRLIGFILFLLPQCIFACGPMVNVFTWANYIPDSVIRQFEKTTGIHVNLSSYDSNEDLYAKLKADPRSGYDVIIPSSYYVQRMTKEQMLHPLAHAELPNSKNLNPALLNKSFDPHNRYSFPYLWGSTGIVVDRRYWDPNSIKRWSDLWQPRFRNQLLMYDDFREVFAVALIVLRQSINTRDPKIIFKAYQELQRLKPNIRVFDTDAAQSIYADDDVSVGMAESGDVIVARHDNPNLVYIYPEDGFAIWEDCLAIPRYAPHYQNALKFINFMMRPDVDKTVVLNQGFASPNMKTKKLLPKSLQNDPVMFPGSKILQRGQFEGDIGDALTIYMRYWELLKL